MLQEAARSITSFSKCKGAAAQDDEEPSTAATSPLANLQKFKGKGSEFIYPANRLSNSESPNQSPALPAALS